MRLLVLAGLLIAVTSLAQPQISQPQNSDNRPSSEVQTTAPLGHPGSTGDQTKEASEKTANKTDSDSRIANYTEMLAAVGALQLIALIVQTYFLFRALNETTTATRLTADALAEAHRFNAANEVLMLESNNNARISADAGRASADALISSERAWVVATDIQRNTPITLSGIGEWGGGGARFICDFRNAGRTVARLTGPFRERFRFVPEGETLPAIPDYGIDQTLFRSDLPESPIHASVLAPGDSNGLVTFAAFDKTITPELLGQIKDCKITVFFFASIKYFDFVNTERELQFCYCYIPENPVHPEWVLGGTKEYNKHT
jgi:hypothetical protein